MTAGPTSPRARSSSSSKAGRPTAPTRRSRPSRRPICPPPGRRGTAPAPVPEARRKPRSARHLTPNSRWMGAAIALGERGRGHTAPNPNVGCVIVSDDAVVGRGWTQDGGRPHAEAMALAEAGEAARGATVYVTLEPCCHRSERGPACADLLVEAGPHKVVIGARRSGSAHRPAAASSGCEAAGIVVETGIWRRGSGTEHGRLLHPGSARPAVRHPEARHVDRRQDRLAVGREPMDHRRGGARPRPSRAGPLRHDPGRPGHLRARLAAARRAPARARGPLAAPRAADTGDAVEGWTRLGARRRSAPSPTSTTCWSRAARQPPPPSSPPTSSTGCSIYRAPILIGDGKSSLGYIGLTDLADAHRRWRLADSRKLGIDRLEVYERSGD